MPLVVVASTSASAATTKALPTAALGAVGLGLSLVDLQRTPAEVSAVQRGNGFVGLAGVGHFNEGEAAGASGLAVGDDTDFFNRSVRFENASQFGLGSAVGEIADVNILHYISSLSKAKCGIPRRRPRKKMNRQRGHSDAVFDDAAGLVCAANPFNISCLRSRRAIFCFRNRLNLALSPLIPDMMKLL
jgi:hypothetical protein